MRHLPGFPVAERFLLVQPMQIQTLLNNRSSASLNLAIKILNSLNHQFYNWSSNTKKRDAEPLKTISRTLIVAKVTESYDFC